MISSKRTTKAHQEGIIAAKATGCNPRLTMNPYYRHSAQWKRFNAGWNEMRKFKFLHKANMAVKYAD